MAERVLVAGATGRLGRELVRQLKEQGYYVRALGRDASKLRHFCQVADERYTLDVLKADDPQNRRELQHACEGMEYVISCIGASVIPSLRQGSGSFTRVDRPANQRLIEAALAAHVRRFVYISVFTDGRLQENDFVRGHEDVVACLRSSELEYVVVRPTGFFSSLVKIMREPSLGLLPQFGNGGARTNPIHEADLAAFCIEKLQDPGKHLEVGVGGPEALTRKQIAELVHGKHKKNRLVIRVPVGALRTGSFVLRPVNRRVSQLMDFIAEVLSSDYVAPHYGKITLSQYLRTIEESAISAG